MFISIFDLFKVSIGPSSSHTMGPMLAASRFLAVIKEKNDQNASSIQVSLYGSLAFTGKGHSTDKAIILGLLGFVPATLEPSKVDMLVEELHEKKSITVADLSPFSFDPENDLVFDYGPALDGHPNGMICSLKDAQGNTLCEETYLLRMPCKC